MTRVFTASLEKTDGGGVSVTLRNLLGEDLCNFEMQGTSLQDLQLELSNPSGPMSKHFRHPRLKFYRGAEPSHELDLQVQLSSLGSELVLKQVDVEMWLEKFPDTGKFLEALRHKNFNPEAENFDRQWTARRAEQVALSDSVSLVQEVFSGEQTHADSESRFVQIFGKLTSSAEEYNLFHLSLCYNIPGLETFKLCLCEHWLEIARSAATSMVLQEVMPAVLLVRSFATGKNSFVVTIGDAFPGHFPKPLQASLAVSDSGPQWRWSNIFRSLLSLDWEFHEGLEDFQALYEAAEQEPPDFALLKPQEISQMVHVQLRLSCCGVAEVQGTMNEVCVKMLAKLLRYKLQILQYESESELQNRIDGLEADDSHRGTLVLVTGLPTSSKGKLHGAPHRLILCYSDTARAVKRPRLS